ncbi:putative ABC transporter ATP-binding protein YtlC [Weizmannia acidilactici]|uniref:ABC transporter ATP-binding protein YtlC n=1 Tax=Weizmannia acidilactici TaxID=2607726 RepID=A0A5J4JFI4_9BACI|nr:ABC transporter ATP-binding protein [Weizmannia acidilactici]GER66500.1 putative ABC transporter ATP-binding protein YtlC [Weizmannia acidilactici]GER69355.1 putative ABC transporter ATP-binding protein YtlC [Weizmannia acidilactici]GER72318.1 putative ABC transporter ATP-binding protein YtlC [Weizmannia acidilactici]
MSFLIVQNVNHTYFTAKQATKALENISFSIREGEFVSLLGPSGCGKTTMLSIISGLLQPTEGEVRIDGKAPDLKASSIGYMLQQDYLFPWKTIEENIFLGLKMKKQLNAESRKNALQLLHDIGLHGVEKQFPRQLSGGMRQRAALVRTLAVNPKILLLDEPFSALDFQTKLKLEDLVFKTLKQFHKTAVLVTHDIGEAISMSDRILLFAAKPGRLHKIFEVPEDLRRIRPFEARSKESYSILFNEIWKELESLENS